MAGQEQKNTPAKQEEEVDEQDTTAEVEKNATLADAVDELLDEIDSVLEEDAEEFVRSFIQKGGQ